MSIINIIGVSHHYGGKLLFKDVTLSLDNYTKAGFVGRNGTGKTTLFKIITRQITPQSGSVHIAKGYKIGYFAQDNHFFCSDKLWDWLYLSNKEILSKKAELIELEKILEKTHEEKLLQKYHDIQTEYELLGGFGYEQEIKSLLLTFGFVESDFHRVIDSFSGGEKTRIRLINILLNKFNFILFDEPTNHLDLVTVDWFIQYLKNLSCGYLIISHDRYLLDQTANKIIELKNQKIESFTGNYSSYEQQSSDKDTLIQKQYDQQQKLIKKTEDFINKNIVRASTSNRAKSRLKMLNKIERIELDAKAKDIRININSSHRSGNDIFRLQNISIGYQTPTSCRDEKCLVHLLADNINLFLHYKDKICLVGANGSGKSTLLKVLTNELSPLAGELWTGYNLSVGYYDQHHIELDNDLSVLDTIWNMVPNETFGYVMTYLARFGFDEDMVEQRVSSLSGGEKSRLYLAQLIHEKPNLLILDEPTNHLDISMIKSLETALKNYDGSLLLVSHDRYFIQAITDDFWVIKDKTIKYYKDSFENIIEKISPYTKEKKAKSIDKPKESEVKPKKLNAYQLEKLMQQISDYENKINELENELYTLQSKFSDPDFYTDKTNIDKANQQINEIKKEIAKCIKNKDILEYEYLEQL